MKAPRYEAVPGTCASQFLFDTGDRFGGIIYLRTVEHYEIINPDLPYADRFRTLGYTLSLASGDGTVNAEFEVTGADMLALATHLAGLAPAALRAEAAP